MFKEVCFQDQISSKAIFILDQVNKKNYNSFN